METLLILPGGGAGNNLAAVGGGVILGDLYPGMDRQLLKYFMNVAFYSTRCKIQSLGYLLISQAVRYQRNNLLLTLRHAYGFQ